MSAVTHQVNIFFKRAKVHDEFSPSPLERSSERSSSCNDPAERSYSVVSEYESRGTRYCSKTTLTRWWSSTVPETSPASRTRKPCTRWIVSPRKDTSVFSVGSTPASGGRTLSNCRVERNDSRYGNSFSRSQLYPYISRRPPDMYSGMDTYSTLTFVWVWGKTARGHAKRAGARILVERRRYELGDGMGVEMLLHQRETRGRSTRGDDHRRSIFVSRTGVA